MSTKTLETAELKAVATAVDQHEIEFYALTFSPFPDKQGDRIDPGAIDEWLDDFYKGGFPLPVSFTHAAILNAQDPHAIIGYAPADVDHVWKDHKGLRVRALLDTGVNEQADRVYELTKRGVIHGASVAYSSQAEMPDPIHEGGNLIMKMRIKESGPCMDPANDEAQVISVKTDGLKWDGAAAMRACSSAADFRSIAFELRNDSAPDTAAHWALPHHNRPGGPPDPGGVSAALGRLNQTGPTVMSKESIRSHLEAHQPSKALDVGENTNISVTIPLAEFESMKAGRRTSRKDRDTILQTIEVLRSLIDDVEERVEGKANAEEPETANAEEPKPTADLRARFAAVLGEETP